MKRPSTLIIILLLFCACNNGPWGAASGIKERMEYLTGFWQNVNDKDDYICISYEMRDLASGKGFWGTFPLALNPKNQNLVDTAKYNAHQSYAGGFQIMGDEVRWTYNKQNSTKYSPDGKLVLLTKDLIKIPTGTYKKLSNAEVHAINPHL